VIGAMFDNWGPTKFRRLGCFSESQVPSVLTFKVSAKTRAAMRAVASVQ
jgi:hypothetical protein